MKVCFLTSNHLPEGRGGTEQVVAALEREFRDRDVETVAITSSDVPDSTADLHSTEHDGIVVHRVYKRLDEWDNSGFVRPRLLGIVRELLGRERPDLVHVHSTSALGTGCAGIARDLGMPVVWTFHDLWSTCARYFRLPQPGITCPDGVDRAPCVDCVDRELAVGAEVVQQALAERDRRVRADLAVASRCTAPSATTARLVAEHTPYDGSIEVVPHGLLRVPDAGHRSAGPRPGAPLRVGTFGGLGPEKGTVELASALRGLACEVHLAGRHGSEAVDGAFRRLAASGTPVVARGAYDLGDRHPARDLDLAVFPSKCQETYGLVVDEALAHGVPCVVSDRGALAERRGHPGVVVTPLAKLRATLHDLVSHPERLERLRAAVPAELPSIAGAAERYLELYREIA